MPRTCVEVIAVDHQRPDRKALMPARVQRRLEQINGRADS